jgi:hypothetical protein
MPRHHCSSTIAAPECNGREDQENMQYSCQAMVYSAGITSRNATLLRLHPRSHSYTRCAVAWHLSGYAIACACVL